MQWRLRQLQMKKELREIEAEKRLRAALYLEQAKKQEQLMPGSQDLHAVQRTVRILRRRGFI